MHRVGIGVGIDGDRADSHSPCRTGDAARDLAAIGDENLVKHRRRAPSSAARAAEPAPVSLRTSARTKRQTFGMSQIISKTMRASTISAAIGCANASHSTVPTARSSPSDADQFENGSGDVLINARLPAFAKWLPAASDPPTMAAASVAAALESPNTLAASAAPAGMRMNVCTKSHTESTPGILSAKNSTQNMNPDAMSTHGCASVARPPGRSTQPR